MAQLVRRPQNFEPGRMMACRSPGCARARSPEFDECGKKSAAHRGGQALAGVRILAVLSVDTAHDVLRVRMPCRCSSPAAFRSSAAVLARVYLVSSREQR